MTISVQLDPPGLLALQKEAEVLGVTPEQLAAEIVKRHLARASDEAFRAALADSMRDNEELLSRLAK